MKSLQLIGRQNELYEKYTNNHKSDLDHEVKNSSFLVLGGAGSIGQAVVKDILQRQPKKLHVIDISENRMIIDDIIIAKTFLNISL